MNRATCINNLGQRTILWLGERDPFEFKRSYLRCEAAAGQIAYRANMADAVDRPARDVALIVVVSTERSDLDAVGLDELDDRHSDCQRIRLLGPLCQGLTRQHDSFFGPHRYNWLAGVNVLHDLIGADANTVQLPDVNHKSVAVVASNYDAAEPLLELAEQMGATAVWMSQPDADRVRGINAVWWDDSFAGPANESMWRERIVGMRSDQATHTWMTNRAHWQEIEQARLAGVDHILEKPYSVDILLDSLQAEQGDQSNAALIQQAA